MTNEPRRAAEDVVTPREFSARIDEVQRSLDLARTSAQNAASDKVELREYIEALLNEGQRATEMAERERSKAADALTAERRAAAEQAERERDKAAQALAVQLAQQIEQGDHALRDHIEQQIMQLQIMLESTRRETDIRTDEQQKAISKAEAANDKRFEAINELRAQMGDLISGHQQAVNTLTSTLMPREVAEARLEDLGNKVATNTSRLDRTSGMGEGEVTARGRAQFTTSTLISIAVAMVSTIAVVVALANYLSTH